MKTKSHLMAGMLIAVFAGLVVGCGTGWEDSSGSGRDGSSARRVRPLNEQPIDQVRTSLFALNAIHELSERDREQEEETVLEIFVSMLAPSIAVGNDASVAFARLTDARILRAVTGHLSPYLQPVTSPADRMESDLRARQSGADRERAFSPEWILETKSGFGRELKQGGPHSARADLVERIMPFSGLVLETAQRLWRDEGRNPEMKEFDRTIRKHFAPGTDTELDPVGTLEALTRFTSKEPVLVREIKRGVNEALRFGSASEVADQMYAGVPQSGDWVESECGKIPPSSAPKPVTDEHSRKANVIFRKAEVAIKVGDLVLGKLLSKPEEARKFTKVAGTVVKVGKLVHGVKIGEIGANLATMNIAGLAKDLLGGLFGGPSAEEQRHKEMMNAIRAVRQDVAELRAHLDERLDRIESQLSDVLGRLDVQLARIDIIDANVHKVLVQVREIANDVAGSRLLFMSGFAELFEQRFNDLRAECLGPRSLLVTSGGMPKELRARCESGMLEWALTHSKSDTRTGRQPEGVGSLLMQTRLLAPGALMPSQLAPITQILVHQLGISEPAEQVNALDWVTGAESFLALRLAARAQGVRENSAKEAVIVGRLLSLGRAALDNMDTVDARLDRLLRVYMTELVFAKQVAGKLSEEKVLRLTLFKRLIARAFEAVHSPVAGKGRVYELMLEHESGLPTGQAILDFRGPVGSPHVSDQRVRDFLDAALVRVQTLRWELGGSGNEGKRAAGGMKQMVQGTLDRLTRYQAGVRGAAL